MADFILTTDDDIFPGPLDDNSGDDLINGLAGNDFIKGGKGNDTLSGGDGNDNLKGGGGADDLSGGDGNDKLNGGGGSDVLSGGNDDDELKGKAGDDTLSGGDGNDTLEGHKGTDTLDGGNGDDTYSVHPKEDSADSYTDSGTGSGDIDTIDATRVDDLLLTASFSAASSGIEVIIGDNTRLVGGSTALTWDFTGITLTGIKQLRGTKEDDTITGSSGDDKLVGRQGNDVLSGGDGNDVVKGGGGDDSLDGGDGNDVVKGGGGDDTLKGGVGTDTLDGGEGSDTYEVELTDITADIYTDTGGVGDVDVLDASANEVPILLLDNSFSAASSGIELILGTAAGTKIQGAFTALDWDFSEISLGNITQLRGTTQDDSITGSAADDKLLGRGGADVLSGGSGEDLLKGGGGDDTLSGGEDDDNLKGGGGDDVLDGGSGDDVLAGGGGSDVLVYDEDDTVKVDGGSGTDTLRFDGSGATLNLLGQAGTLYKNIEIVDLSSTGNNTLLLDEASILALSTSTDTLRVIGADAGNAVRTTAEEWTFNGTVIIDGMTFNEYVNGEATLQVQVGVDQSGISVPFSQAVVALDDVVTVAEDASGVSIDVLANDGDPDGDAVSITAVDNTGTLGTVTNNGDGTLIYDPNDQFELAVGETATDSFTYTIATGSGDTASATVTVTISGVNDAPMMAVNDPLSLIDGTSSAITTALLNEGDVDDSGTGLTYTLTALATNGDLFLSGSLLALNDSSTQADIDNNLLTYVHDGSGAGSDSFAFTLADGGEDGATPVSDTFAVNVTPDIDQAIDITLSADTTTIDEEGVTDDDVIYTISLDAAPTGTNIVSVDIANIGTATDADLTNTLLGDIDTAIAAATGVSRAGSTLSFADSFIAGSFSFTLTAFDDALADSPEAIDIQLTNAAITNGTATVAGGASDNLATTITDIDQAIDITLSADTTTIDEEGVTDDDVIYTISLDAAPTGTNIVSVDIANIGTATDADLTNTLLGDIDTAIAGHRREPRGQHLELC